ncbi:Hypothetical predicted protein [Cloeon dipterum]|uniref:ADP-ribosylation factor n=1 Tax=Cloeon dipterum TaxID=197152 RepID=A0A8S1CT73_9INSE|nr:Hypothetical predicted protein [Cloeon dipterum]
MGLVASLFSKLFRRKEAKILIVGFDGCGKTTILYQMKEGIKVDMVPTIGFNEETFKHKSVMLNIVDFRGIDKIKVFWRLHYDNLRGLIFVIDSTDHERNREVVQSELELLVAEEQLSAVPFLILANKQDKPGATSPVELVQLLSLDALLDDRPWLIQPTCGLTGQGIIEALDWLVDEAAKTKKKKLSK